MSPIKESIKSLEGNARLPPQPCLGLFLRQELPDSTATEAAFVSIALHQEVLLLVLRSTVISLRPTPLIKAPPKITLPRIAVASQSSIAGVNISGNFV